MKLKPKKLVFKTATATPAVKLLAAFRTANTGTTTTPNTAAANGR